MTSVDKLLSLDIEKHNFTAFSQRHDPLHPGTGIDRQSFPEKLGTINTEDLPH